MEFVIAAFLGLWLVGAGIFEMKERIKDEYLLFRNVYLHGDIRCHRNYCQQKGKRCQ